MWHLSHQSGWIKSSFMCLSIVQVLSYGLRSSAYRPESPTTSKTGGGFSDWASRDPRLGKWAREALSYARGLDCDTVSLMAAADCRRIKNIPEEDMNVYVAPPRAQDRTKYSLIVPDGGLRLSGVHDAVLVIDPYPKANFGHLVLIYFIDLGIDRDECAEQNGSYLGHGECLQLAEKQRCRNRLRTRSNHRQCDINFIPLVYRVQDRIKKQQRLVCRDDIGSFGACPIYRTDPANYTLQCELEANSPRCNELGPRQVRARCKFYEICDQAVLISGGWNRHTNIQRHADNVRNVYTMLRNNGFKKPHIKTFFADSGDILDDLDKDVGKHTYPATSKYGIRNHISTICHEANCADTLFIYMNNPALTDGTSLLWDRDQDGLATSDETYSPDELLEDLADCTAKHVYVVADQSFSGRLADSVAALEPTDTRQHSIIFTSGSKHDYSWGSELTDEWVYANHSEQCVTGIYESYQDSLTSSPRMLEEVPNSANTTIFGGPCDQQGQGTYQREDSRNAYMGCQNLPASKWFGRKRRAGK